MTLSQPDDWTINAEEQPVPYALTPQAEALLDELPDPRAEASADHPYAPYVQWEPTPYDLGTTDDPEPEIG